ncbi:MAG TPA: hypothetical protein VFL86_28735 [Burkholderiaceae bacterium]|nr:hypothetical protein [Burkholderiaceae bacterium]
MASQVKDRAMLERAKAGNRIRFTAEKVNSAFTLSTREALK